MHTPRGLILPWQQQENQGVEFHLPYTGTLEIQVQKLTHIVCWHHKSAPGAAEATCKFSMKVHQANIPHNQYYNTKQRNGVKQEVMRQEPIGVYLSQPWGRGAPCLPCLFITSTRAATADFSTGGCITLFPSAQAAVTTIHYNAVSHPGKSVSEHAQPEFSCWVSSGVIYI